MSATLAPPASDLHLALVLGFLAMAPLAIAGVAIVNTGLGRSRSASQALLGSLCIFAIGMVAFAAIGSCFASMSHGIAFTAGGRSWNWIGLGPWMLGSSAASNPILQLTALFAALSAAFCALIPWGAGADRLRLAAGCVIAFLLAGLLFPILFHWIWGGWLSTVMTDRGIVLPPSFWDPSGAATIHVLGGLCALAVVWITGPRRGKFPKEGLATAIPAHNTIYVLFGCLIALVGFMAWNSAGVLLFVGASPEAIPGTFLNTLLASSGALAATFAVTRIRFGKPDASLCANGWMAGLVTSSACAAIVSPGAALFTGAIAGIFTPLLVEVLELALSIDDPTGAIVVHGAGGLWGLFAAGLFAPRHGQFLAQLVGIATLLGVFLPLSYGLFALLNRLVAFRVDPDGERLGMDLHELGGGAYPEFVIHRDDSYR